MVWELGNLQQTHSNTLILMDPLRSSHGPSIAEISDQTLFPTSGWFQTLFGPSRFIADRSMSPVLHTVSAQRAIDDTWGQDTYEFIETGINFAQNVIFFRHPICYKDGYKHPISMCRNDVFVASSFDHTS